MNRNSSSLLCTNTYTHTHSHSHTPHASFPCRTSSTLFLFLLLLHSSSGVTITGSSKQFILDLQEQEIRKRGHTPGWERFRIQPPCPLSSPLSICPNTVHNAPVDDSSVPALVPLGMRDGTSPALLCSLAMVLGLDYWAAVGPPFPLDLPEWVHPGAAAGLSQVLDLEERRNS